MNDGTATGIPRRAFILSSLGSAGVLLPGSVCTAWAAVPDDLSPHTGRSSGRIRIGYLPDSENFACLESLTHSSDGYVDTLNRRVDDEDCSESSHSRLIDAASVRSGDARFALTGVRMRIHGMFTTPGTRLSDIPSLHVYAHAPTQTPVPISAWGYQAAAVPSCSDRCDHCLPVSPFGGLTLSFDVRDAGCACSHTNPLDADFCADHAVVRFGLGGSRDTLKLRRGLYFVAFAAGERSLRRWQGNFAVETAQAVTEEVYDQPGPIYSRLLQRSTLFSGPLAYILLSLDHAKQLENPF